MARAVDHILGFDPLPDVVLVTGDAADQGGQREYGALRNILAPPPPEMPIYFIPTNNDHRRLK
jgi:Icc protein